jgi:hypothetical protein
VEMLFPHHQLYNFDIYFMWRQRAIATFFSPNNSERAVF